MSRIVLSIAVLLVALFTAVCAPVSAQQSADTLAIAQSTSPASLAPQRLVGEYEGSWSRSGFSERAWLEIKEVAADGKLVGRIYYAGGGATTNRWWNFKDGALEGNRLIFKIPASTAEGITFNLEIIDPATLAMKGSSTGAAVNAELNFQKKVK